MRRVVSVIIATCVVLGPRLLVAEDRSERGDAVLDGVLSGLLGQPRPAPDAAYAAKERERLAGLLESGDYVTSRQGEPVDLIVSGVPLTRGDHVYTAKPIPPSAVTSRPR